MGGGAGILDLGDLGAREGLHLAQRRGRVGGTVEELPRERLLRHGPAVLSDAEVLVLVLSRGGGDSAALLRADEVLSAHRGLSRLVGADRSSLGHQGLSPAQSAFLLASIELGRRLAREDLPERYHLSRPAEVVRYLALRYSRHDQEVMGALCLDIRNRLLSEREIFRGALNRRRSSRARS
jgi:DNA repair protein RadC